MFRKKNINSARIEKKCAWCGEVINVGESCKKVTFSTGRVMSSYYMHGECSESQDRSNDRDFIIGSHLRGMNFLRT